MPRISFVLALIGTTLACLLVESIIAFHSKESLEKHLIKAFEHSIYTCTGIFVMYIIQTIQGGGR